MTRVPPVGTFVALFRGINVGGNNLLPMKDLAKLLEAEGLEQVATSTARNWRTVTKVLEMTQA